MADFTDKFSGKTYKIDTFTDLSASVASNPIVDGRIHEFVGFDKLPYRIKRGDQAKFFPGLAEGTSDGKIETGSIIRDTERQIVYVPIKKKNFQDNIIGVGSYTSTSFSSTAYQEISSSLSAKFNNIDGETLITYLVEEFYSSPSASKAAAFVGPVTASLQIFEDGYGNSASFSAIDNLDYGGTDSKGIPDFIIDFSGTSYGTHWQLRFDEPSGQPDADLSSSWFLPTSSLRFRGSNTPSQTASIVLQNAFGVNVQSGSTSGHGTTTTINGSTTADGKYVLYGFRSRIAGDADSGSLYTFLGRSEIISYTRGTETHVNSASFSYSSTSRNEATSSVTYKTLYFYSGSGATSSGSEDFGGMYIPLSGKGTPVHSDINLRFNADAGYYSPSGSQYSSSIYVQTSSLANSGLGPTYAQDLNN